MIPIDIAFLGTSSSLSEKPGVGGYGGLVQLDNTGAAVKGRAGLVKGYVPVVAYAQKLDIAGQFFQKLVVAFAFGGEIGGAAVRHMGVFGQDIYLVKRLVFINQR